MKNLLKIFIMAVLLAPCVSMAEIVVHKKSVVSKPESSSGQSGKVESVMGLLTPVLSTVQGVMQLKQATQELSANCVPTDSEIRTVNELVQEWAKIGDTNANGAVSGLERVSANDTYQNAMENADKNTIYADVFQDSKCKNYSDGCDNTDCNIWCGYPKASKAKLGNGKNVSNIYDIFAKIPFDPKDYTKSELDKVSKLIEKSEKCAPGKIGAKKRELWGNFLTGTIANIGTSAGVSGVGDVMQMATQFSGSSGGVSNLLGGFGQMVPAILDK